MVLFLPAGKARVADEGIDEGKNPRRFDLFTSYSTVTRSAVGTWHSLTLGLKMNCCPLRHLPYGVSLMFAKLWQVSVS